ncbi:cupredoxin domain-containing protein [Lactobacillus mulieris]|uniref:Cupredoxin domain-containing protein n=1 Tax=Lactobacillus mulieris TaxID=2508708 RepID=A0AAW5WW40_9LACO|nr:cupredoxin domain-containing protein [Lactobacillus mulieris]MCZ3621316.1 cupredoxin domain-containing protein [Lactobacillus mulieris]MCZ3623408.1 cupredoxin domain-containing protein [Lactobacillus mulieris]MCZ3635324.1 cupredoxin domain-containing protein [Lactobacillus mulieris]MCZ3689507.1 cupredoxin domain-containing protein [Lactobacillus mulieris]MCZ3695510.1 cupredoxin domain-containing protein [Lactobacillus mulieris]
MRSFSILIAVFIIGFIIWWFFIREVNDTELAKADQNKQKAQIVIQGGYSPSTLFLQKGIPAEVEFLQKDSTACLAEVRSAELALDKKIAPGEKVTIKVPTDQAGEYNYSCGMNMFHGKVVVK